MALSGWKLQGLSTSTYIENMQLQPVQLKQALVINVESYRLSYLWRRSNHHSRRPPNSSKLKITMGTMYLHMGDEL